VTVHGAAGPFADVIGSAEEADDIRASVAGLTVPQLLVRQVQARADEPSIQWQQDGNWHTWSWHEYGLEVARLACALERVGLGQGDRAVLMMHPRPEFHVADSAIMLLGGCPISIYNSSPPARMRSLIHHCQARVLVIDDAKLLAPILDAWSELPHLRHVIVIDPGGSELPRSVLRWDDLIEADPVDLEGYARIGRPQDLCTVVYTSGSTGEPKGVMLDHAAAMWTCESYLRRLQRELTAARWVSYLPVAHIATRFYAQYLHVYAGLEDIMCPNPADIGSVLVDRPPQLFFAPPRLWEQYLESLRAIVAGIEDVEHRARLVGAMEVSQEAALIELEGATVPPELARRRDAARPVCQDLRRRLGLGDLITGATGAAPTTPQMIAAWIGLGVPMFEGYGLSESTGMLTVDPFAYRFGRVGRPMPGVQMRVADDGELLFRGGNAFTGYLNYSEETAHVLGTDGWVHTGDLGRIDDGYVVLEGRKKELIITSGGENVAPVTVELALLAMPLIGQVCVVGNEQPTLGALVVLDAGATSAWADEVGSPVRTADELHLHDDVITEVGREIAAANEHLARPERVSRFCLLAQEWLVDSDELTPTAKLRRSQIATKYASEIARMFAGSATVPSAGAGETAPVG
jgi:long-chain acyl-CoA synthetase